jgi:hypothetical protein
MRLVPLTQRQARAFVAEHHRHNGAPRGDVIRVGVEVDGELVGVATAGRPTAQAYNNGATLEITRVCTLGHDNACSRLYGALCRAGAALGYARAITYTLEGESGASPRAAGFELEAELPERDWSQESGRSRYAENLLGERTTPEGRRRRWGRAL